MQEQLSQLIQNAQRILIATHISPDPDALCSLLLLGTTLRHNYPDKQITMTVEELTGGLKSLTGYDQVAVQTLPEAVSTAKPDLMFIVDAMSFARCTRSDSAKAKELASDSKLVIIDHHEPEGRDEADIYINQNSPAAVQDVYEVCFNWLGLNKPAGYAETTMLGLYSDTGGFVYDNPRHKETFNLVSELIDAGVSIEQIKNSLDQYSSDSMLALGEIADNLSLSADYSKSYISDEFMQSWQQAHKQFEDIHLAVGLFANHYLRNIEGRRWGFIVYPDVRAGEGCYGVSLRAVAGTKDVAAIANKLGGGGHKPAAGAKFKAGSINEALDMVASAIEASSTS
jgi:phosphoesterase RecJ-like protein